MKIKAFLDTNVLMDVLQEGRPNAAYSQIIFQAVRDQKMEAVITTQSLVDAAYVAEKAGRTDVFLASVQKCCDIINVEPISTFDIRSACREYNGDFEDDCQYYRAEDSCCDIIVTSDLDFRKKYQGKNEHIKLMSPKEFVAKMMVPEGTTEPLSGKDR